MKIPKPKRYNTNPITLGDHILNARLDQKLLQEDVATYIGVTSCTLTNWELNYTAPEIRYYPNIFKFIGFVPFVLNTDTLANRLRTFRILNGISQEKLAEMIGINESSIYHYEKFGKKPSKGILRKLKILLDKMDYNPNSNITR